VFHFEHFAKPGQLLEDPMNVLANLRIGRQQAEVGVQGSRAGVIVSGAQVHVASDALGFTADDHQHLGVGLVPYDAIDHLNTRFLQPCRQSDIGLFIEPSAYLDHGGDVFAGARRINQQMHDLRVNTGPVQSLLDRQHVGVDAGLAQQLKHGCEPLVGVMQKHVIASNGREQVGLAAEFSRQAGVVDRILQIRAIDLIDGLHRPGQVDRAIALVHVLGGQFEAVGQEFGDGLGAAGTNFEPDGGRKASLGEFSSQRIGQVLDFLFIDQQFGIARDAELVAANDLHAGEQFGHEVLQHGGKENEIVGPPGIGARNPDEARQ